MNPLAALRALTPHLLAAIALVAMMAQLGFELEPVTDRAAKRHERRVVLRALIFNFVVIPLLAMGVARALSATGPIAIALLLLAAAPGGRHAPALVRASHGDVGLAVEITLFLNKLTSFVSPLLAAWMLGVHRIGLRELSYILQLLILQVVPYFGARQLRKRRPRVAARLVGPARWTMIGACFGLAVYLIAHRALIPALGFGVRGWLAVLSFGAVLLALGWLAGGREAQERRAFALSAEARSLALALVIGSLTVGDPQVLLAIFGAWLTLFALGWAAAFLARGFTRALVPQT